MSLIIEKAIDLLFEKIWNSQIHLFSIIYAFTRGSLHGWDICSCIRLSNSQVCGSWLEIFWYSPKSNIAPTAKHDFSGVGNLAEGKNNLLYDLVLKGIGCVSIIAIQASITRANIKEPFWDQVLLYPRRLSTAKYRPSTIWLIKHATIPIRWTILFSRSIPVDIDFWNKALLNLGTFWDMDGLQNRGSCLLSNIC